MTHGRRAAGLVLATALAASLSACGGSDDPTTTGPTSEPSSSSPSSSPSESTSPSPSPTSTIAPLSRFEDDPAVMAARAWAAALAVDVNNGDLTFAAASPLSTKRGQSKLALYEGSDIKAKLMFPGPLPFTPVRVRTSGSSATIVACTWGQGWGIDRTTQKPIAPRRIDGTDYVMKKTASGWKLNQLVSHDIDCSDVNVKGVAG